MVTRPEQRPFHRNISSMDLFQCTDTWGQLILLTTILNHKSCTNTSRQVLEKTLFAINAIFTEDNNLSKPKVEGSLQKTNATCSKCKTRVVVFDGTAPEKTGPKDGTKFCAPRKMLQA